MEFIGMILAFIAKWYKSGQGNKHRRIGFAMSIFVQSYFIVFFIYSDLWWLSLCSSVNMGFSVRGIVNNKLS